MANPKESWTQRIVTGVVVTGICVFGFIAWVNESQDTHREPTTRPQDYANPANDAKFLAVLEESGLVYADGGAAAIDFALTACQAFEAGYTVEELAELNKQEAISDNEIRTVASAAVLFYCPEYHDALME